MLSASKMRYLDTSHSNFIFWILKRTASETVQRNQIFMYFVIPEIKKKSKDRKRDG